MLICRCNSLSSRSARALLPSLLAAAIAVGCSGGGELGLGDLDTSNLPTKKAERGNFRVTIEEVGVLEAQGVTRVFAPFSGKVASIIPDGKEVETGELLVTLDTEDIYESLESRINDLKIDKADLERTVEQLRTQLLSDTLDSESAEANLEYNRTRLLEVNSQLETLEALALLDVIPQKDVDSKQMQFSGTRLSTIRSDLNYQKEEVGSEVNRDIQRQKLGDLGFKGESSLRRIKAYQDQIDSSKVLAPSSGTWLVAKQWQWSDNRFIPVTPGKEVNEGDFLGEIAREDSLQIVSQVSEAMISHIAADTPVVLTATALNGLKFAGHIERVGNAAIPREQSAAGQLVQMDDASGLKVFEMQIAIDESPKDIRPGMSVDVSVVRSELPDAVSIPLKAVFRDEGLPIVFVRGAKGPEERKLVLGERNKERVVVLEGLEGGEILYMADLNAKLEELRAQQGKKRSGSSAVN